MIVIWLSLCAKKFDQHVCLFGMEISIFALLKPNNDDRSTLQRNARDAWITRSIILFAPETAVSGSMVSMTSLVNSAQNCIYRKQYKRLVVANTRHTTAYLRQFMPNYAYRIRYRQAILTYFYMWFWYAGGRDGIRYLILPLQKRTLLSGKSTKIDWRIVIQVIFTGICRSLSFVKIDSCEMHKVLLNWEQ